MQEPSQALKQYPRKPGWAEELGPPPERCLFCDISIHGWFITGVYSPEHSFVGFMYSVCEACVDRIQRKREDLKERIENEIMRLTRRERVN